MKKIFSYLVNTKYESNHLEDTIQNTKRINKEKYGINIFYLLKYNNFSYKISFLNFFLNYLNS
jgi:hypothetical protein